VETGCRLAESSKGRLWLKNGCFFFSDDDDDDDDDKLIIPTTFSSW
jgi:hypothetical protein